MTRALAVSLALLGASLSLSAAAADDEVAAAVGSVRHVDAAPPGRTLEERFAEIRKRIQSALEYPPMARLRALEGEAVVGFRIGADLHAQEVRVVRTSGAKLLDDAAERAVVAAGRLPYVHGPLEVPVQFDLRRR